MANIKKFDEPITVTFQMEKRTKFKIMERYANITEFLNIAINEKLFKDKDIKPTKI